MARTLLIGNPATTWRDWLREHREDADLLSLNPSEAIGGPAARFTLLRGNRQTWGRFYGSLDPQRAPHVLVAALAESLPLLGEDVIVQLFDYRPVPLLRQVTLLVAQLLRPDSILVARGTELDLDGFPVGPEEVELSAAFPPVVQQAQRKANWMKMLETADDQDIDLRRTTLEGTRIGSGRVLSPDERRKAGLEQAIHIEKSGSTLFVVTEDEPEEGRLARALDVTGATRATLASPDAYNNLLCAFVREGGDEIGMGIITGIDWDAQIMSTRCTAVPPVQPPLVRIGALRVDPSGQERGELRPWQV